MSIQVTKRQEIPSKTVSGNQSFDVADLLVSYLEQLNIEYVFGIPGGAIEPLYNALARSERRGGPRSIVARHETGAAFMAAGYASNSNKIGVCCSTTGPGATNLITGIASAYENNIPLLVITAQTSRESFGKGAFQESSCTGTNIVGMLDYCTHYNTLVSHADQFEYKLYSALTRALQMKGPVHLSIPLDIHRAKLPIKKPTYNVSNIPNNNAVVDTSSIYILEQELLKQEKPVFVIGEDCQDAISDILNIAVILQAEVVTTPHGKGLISPYHPLFRGVIGFAGHESATETLSNKDISSVIAVGTVLSEWANNGWDSQVLLNKKLVHVEQNEKHFLYSPMAKLHLQGSISYIFNKLLASILKRKTSEKINESTAPVEPVKDQSGKLQFQFLMHEQEKCFDNSTPIKPQRLMQELPCIFPQNTIYLVDTGNSMSWGIHYLHPYDRRIRGHRDSKAGLFQSNLEFSSMGWAIGASIGTALARPKQAVVCITGDGSFLMSGQEITVAVQQQLTVIFLVLNDAALGMVKHGQQLAKAEQIGFKLPTVNYASMANAMGINAHNIHSPRDLLNLNIDAICKHKGPTLLDVRIDAEEIPPMGMRIKSLSMPTQIN